VRIRKLIVVAVSVLVAHFVTTLGLRPYRDLLVTVGGWVVRATDIADLPEMFAAGFAIVGGTLVVVALVLVRWGPGMRDPDVG
jgi:hypothetical protein